jgi:hypothetical protein
LTNSSKAFNVPNSSFSSSERNLDLILPIF